MSLKVLGGVSLKKTYAAPCRSTSNVTLTPNSREIDDQLRRIVQGVSFPKCKPQQKTADYEVAEPGGV